MLRDKADAYTGRVPWKEAAEEAASLSKAVMSRPKSAEPDSVFFPEERRRPRTPVREIEKPSPARSPPGFRAPVSL